MEYMDSETRKGMDGNENSGVPRGTNDGVVAEIKMDPPPIPISPQDLTLSLTAGKRLSETALLSRHRIAIVDRVRTLIERKGWSLNRTARECGITNGFLSLVLSDNRMMSLLMIEKLEAKLGPILTIAGRYEKQTKQGAAKVLAEKLSVPVAPKAKKAQPIQIESEEFDRLLGDIY